MSTKTKSVAALRKSATQVKKELIKKINEKVGKKVIKIDLEKHNIMAQYYELKGRVIDQYQYEQIQSIEKDKVNTEDADGEGNEFDLEELDIDALTEICDALKIK